MDQSNCRQTSLDLPALENSTRTLTEVKNRPFVAVIGSFRQHIQQILDAVQRLQIAGAHVNTPLGSQIIVPEVEFVRFETDPESWTNEFIQTVTMHRIFRADFVVVVCVGGYIGRTTCYEVGRVIGANHPIYFTERPMDLPLFVPDSHIVDIATLTDLISAKAFVPSSLFSAEVSDIARLERHLSTGSPLSEVEIAGTYDG